MFPTLLDFSIKDRQTCTHGVSSFINIFYCISVYGNILFITYIAIRSKFYSRTLFNAK